jgi:hypothetical protein
VCSKIEFEEPRIELQEEEGIALRATGSPITSHKHEMCRTCWLPA